MTVAHPACAAPGVLHRPNWVTVSALSFEIQA